MTCKVPFSGGAYSYACDLDPVQRVAFELISAQDRADVDLIDDFLSAIDAPLSMTCLPDRWEDVVALVERLSPPQLAAWAIGAAA